MFYPTDDPIADYDRYDAEQAALDELLPVCCDCGERIADEFCYELNGTILCEDCLKRSCRRQTTDLMG